MSRSGAHRKVHCGTFDAEQYWRDPNLAKLPGLPDADNLRIVSAMDELLFAFCEEGDVLLTRSAMDQAHYQYLKDIGFDFAVNRHALEQHPAQDNGKCVFQLLCEADAQTLAGLIPEGAELEPFAAIPFVREASERFGLTCRIPGMETIRTVNSKAYSTQMRDRLSIRNDALEVSGGEDVQSKGWEMLRQGSFLIKDNYGVSGKGNLFVDSESIWERIVSYVTAQERKGKQAHFILEPFLEKAFDFSCQFSIDEQGGYRLLSLQKLANDGFAYQESYTPEASFLEELEETGYFDLMRRTAEALYQDGYFGHVCIDSMKLKDGTFVPIVEINARKSMSLIKHRIDCYLEPQGVQGNLRHYSLSINNPGLQFEEVLARMEAAGLLFRPGQAGGVIPLTANTLTINQRADKLYKGRIYVSVVGSDAQHRKKQADSLLDLLSGLSLQQIH